MKIQFILTDFLLQKFVEGEDNRPLFSIQYFIVSIVLSSVFCNFYGGYNVLGERKSRLGKDAPAPSSRKPVYLFIDA